MSSSPLSEAPDDATSTTNKRRSGRVSRKPDVYASSPNGAKRKRDHADDEEVEDEVSQEGEASSEDEPDEEEMREKRARERKAKSAAPKKPAAKKPKSNGTATNLAIRTGQGKKRAPKRAKALDSAAAEEAGGLYAEVFASGNTLEDVAKQWLQDFEEFDEEEGDHQARAVSELINLVLKCAGCDAKVTDHDIEDVDGCTNKLSDLQDEYQAQNITEYPIIAKGKGTAAFKASITGFFYTLIKTIYAGGVLFENVELIENIEVWLSSMSAAQNRPFRHTATVVSLAVITALCEIGRDLVNDSAKALRHSESERKKSRVNKARVSELQKQAKDSKQLQEKLDNLVKDWFDTIYIHRYRDVDPRIRVDCAQALGDWIMTYPDVFFDGSHLRYLGWVLSDTYAPARHEVVKQLTRFYKDKDKLGGLKTFTERFRARLVEMATKDHEASVRAATVELLDLLREGGFLEPDDIDAVGRLIFDAEPRVRKAVVGFFADSINEAYDAKIEELGGQENVDEILPSEEGAGFDNPRTEWIKFKCLAQGLESYDSEDAEPMRHVERGVGTDIYHLNTEVAESRFAIAAETLYNQIPEIRQWEALAGYLLYDTSADGQDGADAGTEAQLKEQLRLSEKEEVILLEVLNSSVKGTITQLIEAGSDKKGKRTKKQREELAEESEEAARHLVSLLPRLLKKFGESPQTATTVLRLERVVNLEAFQEYRQDSATYASLLDDINKQFLTHGSEDVLAEASRALLSAKSFAELGEVTDEKIEALWDDTMASFDALTKGKSLNVRTTLPSKVLDAMVKTVLRMERLASITNPISYLESPIQSSGSRKSQARQGASPLESLIALVQQAVHYGSTPEDSEDALLEDSLAIHAARTMRFYFMWLVTSLKTSLESSATKTSSTSINTLREHSEAFTKSLTAVLTGRDPKEDISIEVAGLLLDTNMLLSTVRQIKPSAQSTQSMEDLESVAQDIDSKTLNRILRVYGAAENAFAKASGKVLEAATEDEDVDADPMDADPEAEDDADEDEGEEFDEDGNETQSSQMRRANKMQRSLIAEQRLCELAGKLVLACLGDMVERQRVEKRLERNRARLGVNFKEVVAHLDHGRAKARPKREKQPATNGQAAKKGKPAAKSREIVEEDESEEEDEVMDEIEDGEDEPDEEEEIHVAQQPEDEEVESVLGE